MSVSQISLDNVRTQVLTEVQTSISHMGVGDDDSIPSSAETTLGNETYREALFDEGVSIDTYFSVLFLDVSENNGNDINEVGTFDAPAGGNMFSRALTNSIPKNVNTEVFVEVNIKATVVNV